MSQLFCWNTNQGRVFGETSITHIHDVLFDVLPKKHWFAINSIKGVDLGPLLGGSSHLVSS